VPAPEMSSPAIGRRAAAMASRDAVCTPVNYAATAGVRQAVVDHGLVLLDLHGGEFVILDEVAAAMWQALAHDGLDTGAAQAALLASFDVEPQRLSADLEAFVQRCLSQGWLQLRHAAGPLVPPQVTSVQPTRPKPARPSRTARLAPLYAWWCLVRTGRELRRHGLRGVVERWPELERPGVPDTPDACDSHSLQRALQAFRLAENFYIAARAPDDCLPRSLALFRFLRARGLPAEHCVGYERHASGAHAWVECGGQVLLDEDRRHRLTRLVPIPH
jgi:Transglutaminase-like superfamily/Coenzyme PQQ synthesis protein D (PqqD)